MPLAVALLCHPVGAVMALVTAIVAALCAAQSHRFLPAFTALSAALLAVLAWLQIPLSPIGLLVLCAGVALLHAELLWPTFGAAGLLGLSATIWGCWSLLSALAPLSRAAAALLAAAILVAAVARTMRLRTLRLE